MRKLSSDLTFFGKYVIPPLFIGVMGWVTVNLFLHPATVVSFWLHGVAPPGAKWGGLVTWLVGGIAAVRQAIPMKRVHLDGDTLVISNYFTEHRVPLSAVVDVRQGWFDSTVIIELADPNPFNGTVTFAPVRPTGLLVWRQDPVVTDLRRLSGLDPASPQVRAT